MAYNLGLVAAGRADATWTLTPKHEWDVALELPWCGYPLFQRPNIPVHLHRLPSKMLRVASLLRAASVGILLSSRIARQLYSTLSTDGRNFADLDKLACTLARIK